MSLRDAEIQFEIYEAVTVGEYRLQVYQVIGKCDDFTYKTDRVYAMALNYDDYCLRGTFPTGCPTEDILPTKT